MFYKNDLMEAPKVLIVDDEKEVCYLLGEFLGSNNFEVNYAFNGYDAISKVESFSPHCVLLDLSMPILNGFETLKLIKKRDPQTQVIITTAKKNMKLTEECFRAGAFGFIHKPLDLNHLLGEVQACLSLRKKPVATGTPEPIQEDQKPEPSFKKFELRFFKEMFRTYAYFNLTFFNHGRNVGWLCKMMSEDFEAADSYIIQVAGLYHDLGALFLGLKSGDIIPEDFRWDLTIKAAPLFSLRFLKSFNLPEELLLSIRHQHEWFNGSGDPAGLGREDIPLGARILAVANRYDELASEAGKFSILGNLKGGSAHLDTISRSSSTQFDPKVVKSLSRVITNFNKPRLQKACPVKKLQPGSILVEPLHSKSGVFIFPDNTPMTLLDLSHVYHLNELGIIPDTVNIFTYRKDTRK